MAIGFVALMVCIICRGGRVAISINDNMKLVNTQTVTMEGIDSVDITYYYDDVTFYASENDEMIIKEYKSFTPKKDELAKISKSGSNISIQGDKGDYSWFSNKNGRVDVYLPTKYAGNMKVSTTSGYIGSDLVLKFSDFNASSTSGDITLKDIYANNIDVSASSGYISIQKADGKRKISTTSGDIEVYGGSGDSDFSASSGYITIENASGVMEVETTSGDIEIKNANGNKKIESSSGYISLVNSSGNIKASASSGDVTISDSNGAADISTTSGYIELELTEVTDDINLKASSGDVDVKLPKAFGFHFEANASSGDIDTSFDDKLSYNKEGNSASGDIGVNPDKQVQINTTSGNISVSN
jgi:DUF4097 and DUF4098 domain-containing protein YvlB